MAKNHATNVFRQRLEPGPSCRIIMCARIDHRVWSVVVREMRVVGMTIKGELENAHSGHVEFVAQRTDIGCNNPQVLGYERQITQLSLNRLEEIRARALHPLPGLRCPRSGRHMPSRGKSTEMVQPHEVHVSQRRPQPVYAPAETRAP